MRVDTFCNCKQMQAISEFNWRKTLLSMLCDFVATLPETLAAIIGVRGAGEGFPLYTISEVEIPVSLIQVGVYTQLVPLPTGTVGTLVEAFGLTNEVDYSFDGINQWDYVDQVDTFVSANFLQGFNAAGMYFWAQRLVNADASATLKVSFLGRIV